MMWFGFVKKKIPLNVIKLKEQDWTKQMSVSVPNVTFCWPLRHQHGHEDVANPMCRIKLHRLFVLEPSVILKRSLKKVIKPSLSLTMSGSYAC